MAIKRTYSPMRKEWVCYQAGCELQATTEMRTSYGDAPVSTLAYYCDKHIAEFKREDEETASATGTESPLTADVRRRHADYIDQRSEGVEGE